MGSVGCLITLEWNDPYTDPPNGMRVLAEIFRPLSDPSCRLIPEEFRALTALQGPLVCRIL
jgi:hypothetical protein